MRSVKLSTLVRITHIENDCGGLVRNLLSGYTIPNEEKADKRNSQLKTKIMDSKQNIFFGANRGISTHLSRCDACECECRDVKCSPGNVNYQTHSIRFKSFHFHWNISNDIFLVERMRHAVQQNTPKRNQFNSHLNAFYESAHAHTYANKPANKNTSSSKRKRQRARARRKKAAT